jgi:hypothetical protein
VVAAVTRKRFRKAAASQSRVLKEGLAVVPTHDEDGIMLANIHLLGRTR